MFKVFIQRASIARLLHERLLIGSNRAVNFLLLAVGLVILVPMVLIVLAVLIVGAGLFVLLGAAALVALALRRLAARFRGTIHDDGRRNVRVIQRV